ncbi:MAG TPA: heavy metal translocating P-type ATPase [Jatrophihabitantaceae bacterium]|nr:heavy metal translocating P-type ATPase [Jatrophihabitantaceae bacterium]
MTDTRIAPTPAVSQPRRTRRGAGLWLVREVRWAALALALFAIGGLLQLVGAPAPVWWTAYLVCYAAGGWEPGLAGVRALRAKTLDVDLLMVVAALVAAAIGQVFDGALLIVIFATSGALEAVATKRTRDSVTALLDLAPDQATRVEDGGAEVVVAAADLAVGDHIVVRPGERIGADGVVVGGASDVDQASITGEPLPVAKHSGDEVFAGTMNGTGALHVQVSRPAGQSVVARIVAMVEQASETKARTQLFIDTVEQRYSIGMVTVTVALLVGPLLFGAALQPTLLRAITFMIVASPCAVVLATMPPLLSAIANAGRHGVLVKSAIVMEQLGQTSQVAFDKTGTLTHGTPQLTTIAVADGIDPDRALVAAAAVEASSQHPLGAAVVSAAHAAGLSVPTVAGFDSIPGRGVTGTLDGVAIAVLSPAAVEAALPAVLAQAVTTAEQRGDTAVVLLADAQPVAVLSLTDQLRADAPAAVGALAGATVHPPVLLTGDNAAAARQVARGVGISDVRAGLLPADKVAAVGALERTGARVLLIGDGVNDAPAMAAAYLGIAMGRHGSDLALETADGVVVRDELAALPKVIALSRRARRVVVANLGIAAAIIAALVAWDLLGHLPLPLGVAGHEGSTVIVGLNGLRLLRRGAWQRA